MDEIQLGQHGHAHIGRFRTLEDSQVQAWIPAPCNAIPDPQLCGDLGALHG